MDNIPLQPFQAILPVRQRRSHDPLSPLNELLPGTRNAPPKGIPWVNIGWSVEGAATAKEISYPDITVNKHIPCKHIIGYYNAY